ncbi:unnamed protein product [Spirodela intermedia]|uniref:Uncharacterized protein n=2 Tax=Spirodela intermedia TaxID=51605 RepID=A0A7I8IMU3_SPIIN|nr:unnamed protein product [Spirodela intermedia]CAA6659166.1 unnamed protein product [Spirodela intermedia]CAA7395473.1 unnamed protein product [Spirodela intermedia]
MRLDNILFRLGMRSNIPWYTLINGRIVDISSYRCKPQDKKRSKALIQNNIASTPHEEVPKHLTIASVDNKGQINQIIDSKWIRLKINEILVIEYYSRQTRLRKNNKERFRQLWCKVTGIRRELPHVVQI